MAGTRRQAVPRFFLRGLCATSHALCETLPLQLGYPLKTSKNQLLYVADRESDIYELLLQPRAPGVDLLIRAVRDRKTTAGSVLWSKAAEWPLLDGGSASLAVAARPARLERTAEIELRFGEVELSPPHRPDRQLSTVRLRVAWVREPAAPGGAEPLEWMLLTSASAPGDTWYFARQWPIRDWLEI